jgi:hypothetical protein
MAVRLVLKQRSVNRASMMSPSCPANTPATSSDLGTFATNPVSLNLRIYGQPQRRTTGVTSRVDRQYRRSLHSPG